MKKSLPLLLALVLFSSCSLLERDVQELEAAETGENPPFDPRESNASMEQAYAAEGKSVSTPAASVESEVSRLNTKIAALETKVDVLTANLEKVQLQKSQPVIEANPEPNMAVPVEEGLTQEAAQISAAPVRPTTLPTTVKHGEKPQSGSEKEFRSAMELFQNGKNLEAASSFALFAQKYPQHLLASHALYWAGEASARSQQWDLAQQNWESLEKLYPRSAYLPEALAGLSRAYEKQGSATKAKAYRETLARAFPKSPVALSLQMGSTPAASVQEAEDPIPTYEEPRAEESEHE